MKMKVIHYGAKKYSKAKVGIIKNVQWCKPKGGLWTSPVYSEYGWKEWCESEQFRKCEEENSFTLKIKRNTKIYKIDSLDDLLSLPLIENEMLMSRLIPDFEAIAKIYDAIWLTAEGQWATRFSMPVSLYGWDCECVLILNPHCCYQI